LPTHRDPDKVKAPTSIEEQAKALGLRIPPRRAKLIPQRLDKYYQAQALLTRARVEKDDEPSSFDLLVVRVSEEVD
jgi:hypothetical protein